jgi:phage gp29-like protein
MKKYAILDIEEKIAGSFKLIGYLFWINASWFLCGETAKMHLKAFEDSSLPSPIEVMAFLVLGWLFVLIGEYKSMRLKKR